MRRARVIRLQDVLLGAPVATGAWLCSPPMDYPLEWPPATDVVVEL